MYLEIYQRFKKSIIIFVYGYTILNVPVYGSGTKVYTCIIKQRCIPVRLNFCQDAEFTLTQFLHGIPNQLTSPPSWTIAF